jgi:hypothetical protein
MENKKKCNCNFCQTWQEAKEKKICLVFDEWSQKYFTSYLNPEVWVTKKSGELFKPRFVLIKKFNRYE